VCFSRWVNSSQTTGHNQTSTDRKNSGLLASSSSYTLQRLNCECWSTSSFLPFKSSFSARSRWTHSNHNLKFIDPSLFFSRGSLTLKNILILCADSTVGLIISYYPYALLKILRKLVAHSFSLVFYFTILLLRSGSAYFPLLHLMVPALRKISFINV